MSKERYSSLAHVLHAEDWFDVVRSSEIVDLLTDLLQSLGGINAEAKDILAALQKRTLNERNNICVQPAPTFP